MTRDHHEVGVERIVRSLIALAVSSIVPAALSAQDPAKVVGPAECVECHEAAHDVWQETLHQSVYETFHRAEKTRAVLERMGERSARRGVCVDCHYTSQDDGRRVRTIAGVSCESCHGAAADWMDAHGNFGMTAGGERADASTETRAHRTQRLQTTAAAGMIRPDRPYLLVRNCMQCHTTPNEELVNTGQHAPGSDFEIVPRLFGEIRHNFQLSGDATNRMAARDYDPTNRKRLFFVLGEMVELEHALRRLAEATTAGTYATAMADRARQAMERLRAIQSAAPAVAAVEQILAAADDVELAPNNGAALAAAADEAQAAAQAFARQHDGSALGGLDALVPAIK